MRNKAEGVQKELLGLLEGTSVATKYGNVKTDHILFIASGAFHGSKPSDLLPELQGRLPIRVRLEQLTTEDLRRILTEKENNLLQQQSALLATERVRLDFTPCAVSEMARLAVELNTSIENIGARRLNTIIAKVLATISYTAPTVSRRAALQGLGEHVERIDGEYVRRAILEIKDQVDLQKYVL